MKNFQKINFSTKNCCGKSSKIQIRADRAGPGRAGILQVWKILSFFLLKTAYNSGIHMQKNEENSHDNTQKSRIFSPKMHKNA